VAVARYQAFLAYSSEKSVHAVGTLLEFSPQSRFTVGTAFYLYIPCREPLLLDGSGVLPSTSFLIREYANLTFSKSKLEGNHFRWSSGF